jgi:hypothetical protein
VPGTDRLQCSQYCGHDEHARRQRLRDRWLYNQVGGMAKRAIRLNGLSVRVRMTNLHNRSAGNEGAAEKAKRYPERVTCSLIEGAT